MNLSKYPLKIALTFLLIACLVGLVFISRATWFNPILKNIDEDIKRQSQGSPSAEIWVIEFIDFQCADCSDASRYMDQLVLKYPDKIYRQIRLNPLMKTHEHAKEAALLAYCAAKKERFHEVSKLFFEHQAQWAESKDVSAQLDILLGRAGLNAQQIRKCALDPKTEEAVLRQKQSALDAGVMGTPTFFVNGEMVFGLTALKEELLQYELH